MKYYVSVTGVRLKSAWHRPRFEWHAISSFLQARSAKGNVSASVTVRNGINHTLTVWEDRKSMTRFMVSGAHARAMKVVDIVCDPDGNKVHGYESDTIPTWEEALKEWDTHGRWHGKKVVPKKNMPRTTNPANGSSWKMVAAIGVVAVLGLSLSPAWAST